MPVVTFRRSDLCRVIGRDVPMAELQERMPMLGGDVERVEGDTLHMEWFPNRPDLLTLEGTGRALRAFLGVKPGLPSYAVEKPRTELKVDASVQAVRPYAALCFVRGIKVDEAYLQVLIEAQEKLTFSPGRRRRKVAIGIHDAAGLKGPFTYTAVGPSDKPFVPLNETRKMTPAQIMAEHPKGREYGHLLPAGKFPVFLDAAGEVLSLPPVINAQRTAVTTRTTDVLLDVTGTDARSVRQTIALLATSLAEHGGRIEAVTVHDASGAWACPDLKPSEHVLHTDQAAALLGMQWSGDEVARCLRRMGHDADAYDNKVHVKSAAWRQDLLHEVDLLEDVAIGFGFESFPGTLPQRATFAGRLPQQGLEDTLRRLLTGHGYLEARTLTLSDAKSQWANWGAPAEPHVQLLNPVLEEQTLLRIRLLPSLLAVLAANRHRPLPQRLFEIGHVVVRDGDAWRNRLHLALVECSAKAGFSDAKGLAEALVRDAALPVELAPGATRGLIAGRQGSLKAKGTSVGHFGELHPDTLVAFGLAAPATVLEMDLSRLA
ncbi:MAG: phenylalanyl-tRNA synthetase beta chain [Thermoplasmata archaeon]|jgi:phenylalanyl-tRNA synthetase beta chain|nr:phenylalanyl-tRNA synthetase beta chain [Thermoplasmata archaeon]